MPFASLHTDDETREPLDIYYELHGSGPRLLSIGGTGADLRTSYPDRSPLNKHFTVLHFDQRGLGRSGKPDGPYTMRQYADDAAALVHSVGWSGCHVVGTSFGGMVAQHLAVRHSGLVHRLVLSCTSPGGVAPSFPLHLIESLDVEARIELLLPLYDCRWDPDRIDPIPGLGPFYDQMVQRMREPRVGDALTGYRNQIEARSNHDTTAVLHLIESPTFVCAGESDDMAPVANSQYLVDRIPDATIQVFDGGHLFLLQDRSAFNAIINFLNGGV